MREEERLPSRPRRLSQAMAMWQPGRCTLVATAFVVLGACAATAKAAEFGTSPTSEVEDDILRRLLAGHKSQHHDLDDVRLNEMHAQVEHREAESTDTAKEPEGKENEGEGEKEAEGEEGEEEGEEEEEEAFSDADLTCGICLLSFITFNMTLYYLVNWNDEDMRIYVWTVISTTVSIFIAVFTFSSIHLIFNHFFIKPGDSQSWHAGLSFIQLALWFTIMQVSVAFVSGALESNPFPTSPRGERKKESQKEEKEREAKEIHQLQLERKIRFKSVATMFAHITGFAAITAGGCLQHMYPFNSSAAMRFLVPPLMFAGQLVVGRLIRMIRLRMKAKILSDHEYAALQVDGAQKSKASRMEDVHWCLEAWDDETYESELDVAGLCISFLLVQACRYAITGIMPNNLGIEEPSLVHPHSCTVWLVGIGLLFAALCVVCVILHTCMPEKIEPGTIMSTARRMVLVSQTSFAMAFSWCLFTASKWEIARQFPEFAPNGVISRVLLAMELSAVAFVVIVMLDKLADLESTGQVADRAIITIIGALSTLVGFSFEQSFDGAVEALADLCFKQQTMLAELVLATAVVIIVYPAWRMYILRKLLELKDAKHKANQAAGSRCIEDELQDA